MYSQNLLKSTKKLEQISINWQNSGHELILEDIRKASESLLSLPSFQINRVVDVLDVEALVHVFLIVATAYNRNNGSMQSKS